MRKAFSLIELLIVVVIIGIVYSLSLDSIKSLTEKKQFSLKDLKNYMKSIPYTEKVKIVCLKGNEKCTIYVDSEKYEERKLFSDENIETYRYDFSYGMVKLEMDEDSYFSYTMDKNGAGQQIFVKYQNRVYDFTTYLGNIPIYNSLEEAQSSKEILIQEILR